MKWKDGARYWTVSATSAAAMALASCGFESGRWIMKVVSCGVVWCGKHNVGGGRRGGHHHTPAPTCVAVPAACETAEREKLPETGYDAKKAATALAAPNASSSRLTCRG